MEFEIKVRDGQVVVGEQVRQLLDYAKHVDLEQKRLAIQLDEFKEALKVAMEENGIKTFENDLVKISYKEPHVRQSVDTKKMKEEGIYDLFTKEVNVKGSLSLSFKE